MVVQVLAAGDIGAHVLITGRTLKVAIAAIIPAVPVVFRDLVAISQFGVRLSSARHNRAAAADSLGSLGRKHLGLARTDCDLGRAVFADFDAIRTSFHRANRNRRSGEFHFSRLLAHHSKSDQAAGELHHVAIRFDLGDAHLRIGGHPNHVGVVKLKFSARVRARKNAVLHKERRIEGRSRQISRVAPFDRDVTVREADTGHAATRTIFFFEVAGGLGGQRSYEQNAHQRQT